jgi:thiamine biosynthesis protein ThiS
MSQQSVASEKTVSLTVNGEEKELPAGSSVADLLASHKLDPRMVVVEHNRVILRDRDAYARIGLNDGDTIEIVHFVGGG